MLSSDTIRLKSKHDGKKIYQYFFEYAGEVDETGVYNPSEGEKFASDTINLFIVPQDGSTDRSVY